jgi:Pectate lyase superfamily protein
LFCPEEMLEREGWMKLRSDMSRMVVAVVGVGLIVGMLLSRADAQVTTTNVSGTVYRADGSLASGTLLVSWPAFSTAANQAVAAGSISTTIGTNGFVSLNLAPNSGAYPAGTYYTAVYHLNDGTVSREYWVVPATPSTAIGSVRALLAPATVAVQDVSKAYVDDSIAAITGNYVPLAGGTMAGPLQLSSDPVSTDQAATKHYVDALAATELPLSGGSLSGTLDTPNSVNEQPRVDVTYPGFATGCSNAADPTGTNDSTCAIEAAIAYAQTVKYVGAVSAIYFPHGTYKISSNLDVPCFMRLEGDGMSHSIIEETNNQAGITIDGTINDPYSLAWTCTGDVDNLSIVTYNGSSYRANQLELYEAVGERLLNVRVGGGAGRGIVLIGNTERVKAWNIEIDQVRWPLVFGGNENHLWGLNINDPGQDGSGYCWGTGNCANGVYPNQFEWESGGTLESASANGTVASFYVYNATSGYSGISPLVVGHHFVVSGTTGTVLDGTYTVTSVTNGVTSDPSGLCTSSHKCFEVQGASTQNGTANVSSATWLPAILPDRNAAVYLAGQDELIDGGSIKSLWYAGAFQAQGMDGSQISHMYTEGFPEYGQPHLDADLVEPGLPPVTSLSTAMTTGGAQAVTIADSCLWEHGFANTATEAQAIGGPESFIEPQDFTPGSTAASAYVPGVEQGQYELVDGACAANGNYYVNSRNLSGSTAPANTAWPVGSIIAETAGPSSSGTLTLASNHFNAVDTPGSNWAVDCQDNAENICGEIIIGNIPNGHGSFDNGSPSPLNGFGNNGNITLIGGVWEEGSGSETNGQGWIKARGHEAAVQTMLGSNSTLGAYGYSAITGNFPALSSGSEPLFINVEEADSSYPYSQFSNLDVGLSYSSSQGPEFVKRLGWGGDPVTGNNPGSSSGSNLGIQFSNSYCQYDLPTSSSTHSLNRVCVKGGPSNTGPNAGWEYDVWNGSAWVNAFGISAQSNSTANAEVSGSLTAAEINKEVTVDGVTYSNLNAAWSAAVALANSSGQNQTVRLGPGTFNVSSTLMEPSNGSCVNLIGSGGTTVNADSATATTLSVPANLGGDVFYLGNAAQAQGCTFRDFVILANANATHGFELQWFRGLLIDNVAVNDTTAEGILLGEESTSSGHQANFLLRNVTVSYSTTVFSPASRPAYGVHLQLTAIDSYMDGVVVRNALTAAVYNEGTGNTGYLVHGFGYPYTCATGPCVNNASSGSASNASYATSYVIDDVGGGGSVWTDTYADSPAVAGFYIGANGVAIHGGHIQWPDLTSFPAANLAYVAAGVTNNMLIADVSCLGMNSNVNWITYAGTSGNPPTFSSVHNLTGCGNYEQDLNPAQVTGFSSGGANINDPSGAIPRVWSTPIAASSSYPAYSAQFYTGYQGDVLQGHFSGVSPFFNVTYQGTIKSNGGLALSTIINTASTLTLTPANKNVISNAASGAQTITLPSCYTAWPDKASPTGLEFTIIKSDASSNAVTLQTVSSQQINYEGALTQSLSITSAGKRTLVCGPDYNWYAY